MTKSVWKKLAILSAVLCILVGMTSCGKTVSLSMGETATVDKHVEFTAENIIVSPEVFPPISGKEPMGWVLDDESKTYVTIVSTIKNLSDKALSMEDLWYDFSICLQEEYIDGTIVAATTNNDTKLNDSKPIGSGKTKTVYFITEIDKADLKETMEAEFDFGGTTLVLPLETSRKVADSTLIDLRESYKVDGLGTVTPKSIAFMDELEPSNPGYTYEYYAPQTKDDQLLVLKASAENTTTKSKSAYRYMNIMAFVGDEPYLGEVVSDDEYSANIVFGDKLYAGETRNIYAIVNLPKSVKESDCKIYIYIDGKYYRYNLE